MKRTALSILALAVACGGAGDHERRGDEAYGEGRFADALTEYTAVLGGTPGAPLLAKAGAAALHGGRLQQAADDYIRLAAEDPSRAAEAAEGLEAVARAADRESQPGPLHHALDGLQAIGPERLTGRFAMLLASRPGADDAERVALLPGAIAAATEPTTVDSLLTAYGLALQQTAGCGQALLQFRAVLRRTADTTVRARARQGVTQCAYALGERSDSQGKLLDAALWFAEAARADSVSPIGRRAGLKAAEARLAQGDTIAAAIALQSILSVGRADSVGQVALGHLHSLGIVAAPPDSSAGEGRP